MKPTLNAKLYEMKYLILLFTLSILSCSKDDASTHLEANVTNTHIENTFSEQPNDALFLPNGNICVLATSQKHSGLTFNILSETDGELLESKELLPQSNLFARDLLDAQSKYFILADYELTQETRNVKCIEVNTALTYVKTFNINSLHHEVAVKMIKQDNENYIILVNRKNKGTETWGFVLYETNGIEVLNTHEFPHPILQSGSDIIRKQDGSGYYVFAHVIEDPLNSTDFVLYEFDNALQVVQKKYFGGNQYEEARRILEDQTGNIYLFGHSASKDIHHQIYLVKLDSDLNTVYENHYGSEYHDGGQTLCFDENQRLTLIGRTDAPNNTNESIYYLKINADGSEVDHFILGNESLKNRSDIVLHNNGTDYVIGYTTIDNNFTKNIDVYLINY